MPQTFRCPLIQPFYPSINGLRGLAFLMVFAYHYCQTRWDKGVLGWGWVGVDLFFVLSGFLITGSLYDSLHKPGYFRTFYMRRALRIFPLFYSFWVVLLILTPLVHFAWNRYNLSSALFIGNFFLQGGHLLHHPDSMRVAFGSNSLDSSARVLSFEHFWTLCVEEQFYLLWPVIVWLLPKRSHLLTFCIGVIIAMPFLRVLYAHLHPSATVGAAIYVNTFFRADTLLLGAALALWLRGTRMPLDKIRRSAFISTGAAPLLLAICFFFTPKLHSTNDMAISDPVVYTFGYSLIAIAAGALMLLGIDSGAWVARFLKARPLMALGRISYGLYFYHYLPAAWYPGWIVKLNRFHLAFLAPIAVFAGTLGIAWLSFRFLETPFLKLKDPPKARILSRVQDQGFTPAS